MTTRATGVAARTRAPLEDQGEFVAGPDRGDPIAILREQAVSRVPELVPVRYGRMLVSPFTFYRGAAAVMAADLGRAPSSGLLVQLCGDAHLSNFGLFGSPERRLLFDVNDFDETYPGPFEWDVKRLAASLVIAARDNGFTGKQQRRAARAATTAYQKAMAEFANASELQVWYSRADVDELRTTVDASLSKQRARRLDQQTAKALTRDSGQAYGKLTVTVDGQTRLVSNPPLVVPIAELFPDRGRDEMIEQLRELLSAYRSTLHSNRRVLLDRFEFVDMAHKVVGVGSVGTRCWIVLLRGNERHDPLFLQVKQAQRSVLAPYVPQTEPLSTYTDEAERVVSGQRLMQAASDIFLGWKPTDPTDPQELHHYVRQLRDWKTSIIIEDLAPNEMNTYAELCGWTLARAHARSGQRTAIASYLGDDDSFQRAITRFAVSYADQNEQDHAALRDAAQTGRITAQAGI